MSEMNDSEETEVKPKYQRKNRMFLSNGHDCEFAYDLDEVAKFIPGGGIHRKIQRYFTRLRMVSEINRSDNYTLRSQGAIALEKRRHLQSSYLIIHPFSDFRKYWEIFMIVVLLMQFIMIPLDVAFVRSKITEFSFTLAWSSIRFTCDILCCLDVVATFLTGYYDDSKKVVVLKPYMIAGNYFGTFFFPDILSSIPTNLDVVLDIEVSRTVMLILSIASVMKLLRLITFARYCRNTASVSYHPVVQSNKCK